MRMLRALSQEGLHHPNSPHGPSSIAKGQKQDAEQLGETQSTPSALQRPSEG